jgi:hypothetical protein
VVGRQASTHAETEGTVAHLVGGQPIGRRRVLIAAGSFSLFVAGLGATLGFLLRDVIRAL